MHYQLISSLSPITSECLILGILADEDLSNTHLKLHSDTYGLINKLRQGLVEDGQYKWQSDHQDHSILLINCGFRKDYNQAKITKCIANAIKQTLAQKYKSASICFPILNNQESPETQLKTMILSIDSNCYTQPQYKTKNNTTSLTDVKIYLDKAQASHLEQATVVAQAVAKARYFADLPANDLTPTILADQASQLAQDCPNITCKIHELSEIKKLKMGGLLAVSQGSAEPPCFIEMGYKHPNVTKSPIVLVGKGVTFDAGGISLKPPAGMNEMKYDMCGAASVIAVIWACAKLQLPVHVIGLVPATENLPSGTAVKPGDIITMMSGKTIEVVNTDAEGRLILADALTYAERFKPELVIDIATLTGAVIIALGGEYTGLMSPNDQLANQLLAAANKSNDKLWRLPLDEAYDAHLDSPIADMMNAHFDRAAGSIVAGMFLSKFTQSYPWAHLDIAGTAWISGSKRVSTGRPVPLLMEFLNNASQKS